MIDPTMMQRVTLDPQVMMGKPVITGTRIPVSVILNQLAHGQTAAQVMAAYPRLTEKDIHAAMRYAAALADEETREFA